MPNGSNVKRKDGRELHRLTIYLPIELARQLRIHCAETDSQMSHFVTEAIRQRLADDQESTTSTRSNR
ncbi:MAG: hypothetical protein PHN49_11970 [Candidatus Omnitrophica bacterium]|nr:hypothetical protein [Candidatus Omnitrophota bacterium]